MPTFQDVLDAARSLSADDRARLLDALWEDCPPTEWPVPSEAWVAECQRRSEEYDRGHMKASPFSEVRTRARREAGLD